MHPHAEPVQVAAFERDATPVAILHNQEEAIVPLAERGRVLELAQQDNLGARQGFQQEVQNHLVTMQTYLSGLSFFLDHLNLGQVWVINN